MICLFLVGSSLFTYRWLQLRDEQILLGKALIDSNQIELRKLKIKIDEFNTVAYALNNDTLLGKAYFEKKVTHHSEFDREGIKNIDTILNTTYSSDGFFELSRLMIRHEPSANKEAPPQVTMVLEGEKRLEKQ